MNKNVTQKQSNVEYIKMKYAKWNDYMSFIRRGNWDREIELSATKKPTKTNELCLVS